MSGERDFFAKMVVDAVTKLDPETLDLRMLGIKKVQVRRRQGGGQICMDTWRPAAAKGAAAVESPACMFFF